MVLVTLAIILIAYVCQNISDVMKVYVSTFLSSKSDWRFLQNTFESEDNL